jgi:hypothetical protein
MQQREHLLFSFGRKNLLLNRRAFWLGNPAIRLGYEGLFISASCVGIMNRRSVLSTAALLVSIGIAGCSSGDSPDPQCHLMHEIVESPENYGEAVETYRYGELSSEAQQVVEKTIANGSYSTANRSFEAPEFRYWDTTTVYNITYQNQTYVLLTYTGEGCESR